MQQGTAKTQTGFSAKAYREERNNPGTSIKKRTCSAKEEMMAQGWATRLEGKDEDVGEDEKDEEEPGPEAADQANLQRDGAQERYEDSLAHREDIIHRAHAIGGNSVVGDEEADGRVHGRHQNAVLPERQCRQARPRVVRLRQATTNQRKSHVLISENTP